MTDVLVRRPRSAAAALDALVRERVRLAARIAIADPEDDPPPALSEALATADAAIAGPAGAPLRRLCALFRVERRETDLLETCLALALDPTLRDLFARTDASAGRGWVTESLVARLFGHPRGRVFNPAGALALWELVAAQGVGPGEPDALVVDPVVPAWLAGELWIDRVLAGVVRSAEPCAPLASRPVDAAAAAVRRALSAGRPIRVVVCGEAGSGRAAFASAASRAASLPALLVDTADVAEADWPRVHVRLQRLAAVSGAALVWTGAQAARPWPALVAPAPVHFVAVEPGTALRPLPNAFAHRVEMPVLTIAERRGLWASLVDGAASWPAADLDSLAARYRLGAGDIAEIAAESPRGPDEAALAARRLRGAASDDVVHALPCPFRWDDLVVPDALRSALADLAFEAAERERVEEEPATSRLLPRGNGLVALFAGPSGTGKTMAAQVVAAHLGLDLLRVDLASLTSKYIGETAKNLTRAFTLARNRQAILLFDEADACFARRTDVKDAHDRHANADTSHLLQLIEAHRGVVILATNRRGDMDPAFVRRLRHVLEFPRPQPAERLKLWRQAVSAAAPRRWQGLSPKVGEIAEQVDVSGAQIRQAVLSALFMARRDGAVLGLAHLVRGLDRELAKEGRPLSAEDRERWLPHA